MILVLNWPLLLLIAACTVAAVLIAGILGMLVFSAIDGAARLWGRFRA